MHPFDLMCYVYDYKTTHVTKESEVLFWTWDDIE